MRRVVTLGEIMLRLTPPGFQRLQQATSLDVTFGGAEANVAVALAQLGGSAAYVTKLPANEIADRALNELRGLGVDVSHVVRGGDRIGVYFLEQGASQRSGKVIYDRANSAIATADPAEFHWPLIFEGASWFHWSGITPALSASTRQIAEQACIAARDLGLTISFDLNYRGKLWTLAEAGETLASLMQYVDLCVTSAEEAKAVFGIECGDGADKEEQAARALQERFGFRQIALTQRRATVAERTHWAATLFSEGEAYRSRDYDIAIVDRVGAGDSFSGALIFSLLRGDAPQAAVDFAVAASSLKHTIMGDYNLVSLAEVEALAGGQGGGRVQR